MSNHIHLIVSTKEPITLSEVLKDFKKFTSTNIIRQFKREQKKLDALDF